MKAQFQDLKTTKKGRAGEELVRAFLKERGYHVYTPETGSHPVDMIAVGKGRTFAVEAKCYPRLDKYPATGVDDADWVTYGQLLECCIPVFLAFVDCIEGRMYGNWVDKLIGHERELSDKVIFPLSILPTLRLLTPAEVAKLNNYP